MSTSSSSVAVPSATPTTPNYDLTQTLAKYLDKHMVLPLLDFLHEKKVRRGERVCGMRNAG
jgi:hypothetical protein